MVEERADARKEGVAILPLLALNPNLNSNKASRYDQVLASCEGLVELQPDEVIGDLCRGRAGTALLGDGPGQSDASGELLLSTPKSAQFFWLFSLRTNEGALKNQVGPNWRVRHGGCLRPD